MWTASTSVHIFDPQSKITKSTERKAHTVTTDQPRKTGRAHWLEAEQLLAQGSLHEALVHALLAQAAPAYAFHQAARQPVPAQPATLAANTEIGVPHRGDKRIEPITDHAFDPAYGLDRCGRRLAPKGVRCFAPRSWHVTVRTAGA